MPYDGFVPHSSHRSPDAPVLSIVVPAYNESAGIQTFHETLLLPALAAVTERLTERSMGADTYEIIYVNDGSTDNTLEKLQEFAQGSTTTRVVNLSRNFGGLFKSLPSRKKHQPPHHRKHPPVRPQRPPEPSMQNTPGLNIGNDSLNDRTQPINLTIHCLTIPA